MALAARAGVNFNVLVLTRGAAATIASVQGRFSRAYAVFAQRDARRTVDTCHRRNKDASCPFTNGLAIGAYALLGQLTKLGRGTELKRGHVASIQYEKTGQQAHRLDDLLRTRTFTSSSNFTFASFAEENFKLRPRAQANHSQIGLASVELLFGAIEDLSASLAQAAASRPRWMHWLSQESYQPNHSVVLERVCAPTAVLSPTIFSIIGTHLLPCGAPPRDGSQALSQHRRRPCRTGLGWTPSMNKSAIECLPERLDGMGHVTSQVVESITSLANDWTTTFEPELPQLRGTNFITQDVTHQTVHLSAYGVDGSSLYCHMRNFTSRTQLLQKYVDTSDLISRHYECHLIPPLDVFFNLKGMVVLGQPHWFDPTPM